MKRSVKLSILATPCVVLAGLLAIGLSASPESTPKHHHSAEAKPRHSPSAKPSKKPILDDDGRFACRDFGNGYTPGMTGKDRLDLAKKVYVFASHSKSEGISSGAEALANAAAGNVSADMWETVANLFAQSCLDDGFKN